MKSRQATSVTACQFKIFCGRSCSFNTRRSWSLAPLVSSVQEAAVIQSQIPNILGLPIPPNVKVMVSWLSAHIIPDGALHLKHPNRKFKGTALLLQYNGRSRAVNSCPLSLSESMCTSSIIVGTIVQPLYRSLQCWSKPAPYLRKLLVLIVTICFRCLPSHWYMSIG